MLRNEWVNDEKKKEWREKWKSDEFCRVSWILNTSREVNASKLMMFVMNWWRDRLMLIVQSADESTAS
jgi:hypothetical protein